MSKGIYDALDIAKYIVDKCTTEKCPITNLQLQKIMYFLQKKYLVEYSGVAIWSGCSRSILSVLRIWFMCDNNEIYCKNRT